MGRMHVQRAIQMANGPALIVASDTSDDRLKSLADTVRPRAAKRGVRARLGQPGDDEAEGI